MPFHIFYLKINEMLDFDLRGKNWVVFSYCALTLEDLRGRALVSWILRFCIVSPSSLLSWRLGKVEDSICPTCKHSTICRSVSGEIFGYVGKFVEIDLFITGYESLMQFQSGKL